MVNLSSLSFSISDRSSSLFPTGNIFSWRSTAIKRKENKLDAHSRKCGAMKTGFCRLVLPQLLDNYSGAYSSGTLFSAMEIEGNGSAETSGDSFEENQTEIEEKLLDEKEYQRRKKISAANSGKVPWNKGLKWSPEVLARIKEKTQEAMKQKKTRRKMESIGRQPTSEEVKLKIRIGLQPFHEKRKLEAEIKNCLLLLWKCEISDMATVGLLGDHELVRLGPRKFDYKDPEVALQSKKKLKPPRPRSQKSEEHRQKISEAIRLKWLDPEYREKAVANIDQKRGKISEARKKLTQERRLLREQKKSESELLPRRPRKRAAKPKKENLPIADPKLVDFVMGSQEVVEEVKKVDTRKKKVTIINRMDSSSIADDRTGLKETNDEGSESRDESEIDSKSEEEGTDLVREKTNQLTGKARMLMKEAEMLTQALEGSLDLDDEARMQLEETRKILEEAAESLREAEEAILDVGSPRDMDDSDQELKNTVENLEFSFLEPDFDSILRSFKVNGKANHKHGVNGFSLDKVMDLDIGEILEFEGDKEPRGEGIFSEEIDEGHP